jgi:4-hydroxy-tetrahydrodipicolinate synthase
MHPSVKSRGDPEQLLMTRLKWDGPLCTGSSALLTMAGSIGCVGAILTLANAMPELCIAAFGGDGEAQVRLIENHLAVNRDFPAEIKHLTSERFGTSRFARLR